MRTIRNPIAMFMAVALVCLAACTNAPPGSAGSTPAVSPAKAALAVADTAAAVADAMKVAPPATLSRTTIDEKGIRASYKLFERALTFIDVLIANGRLPYGSPKALTVQAGIRKVQTALNTASAAQKAGNAGTYGEALRQAKAALASLQIAIGE